MFCEKCGRQLEDSERFCSNCGAPVPHIPEDKPSGGKKRAVITLIAGGVVLLAVAALCIANASWLGNFFRRSFSSPEAYYRHVEEATVSELSAWLGRSYEVFTAGSLSRKESSTGAELTVELGEGGRELLGLLGTAGPDLGWLNELSVGMGVSRKDSVLGYAFSFGLNRNRLLSANMVLDTQEGGMYLRIPELTADYIGMDLADLIGRDWQDSFELYREMEESRRQMVSALPDVKEVEKLQQKYLRLVLEGINKVERSRRTLKAGGISQKCTELEVTIDGMTLAGMLEAMLEEMQEDKDLQKLIVNTVDGLMAADGISYLDGYTDYGWSGEDCYQEFLEELAEMQADLDELRDLGDVLVMKVYVDGRGRIVGRMLELMEDGELSSRVSFLMPQKGSRTGYEISAASGYGDGEIALTGSGKTSGNKLNGDFGLTYDGLTVLDVEVADLDLKQWEQGYLNGSFTVTPSRAISSLLSASLSGYDTLITSMLSSLQLTLDSKMSSKAGSITLGLKRDKEELVRFTVSVRKGEGPETGIPSADDTVFLKEEADLEAWWSGIDWDAFIGKLEQADLPEEVLDALREGIALFAGDGIGTLLNPYYPYDFDDLYDYDDFGSGSEGYDDFGPGPEGYDEPETENSLESVLQSEDWQNEIINWNEQVRDLGITIDAVADGNVLVFEWYLPEGDIFDEKVCGIMADNFLGTMEDIDFLSAFRIGYDVTLEGVRCTFYGADGSEVYRDEINFKE